MSTKKGRKGRKMTEELESEDFETFVRGRLYMLCQDVEQIKRGHEELMLELSSLRRIVSENTKNIEAFQVKTDFFISMQEKTEGELHETRIKLDELEIAFKDHASKLSSTFD